MGGEEERAGFFRVVIPRVTIGGGERRGGGRRRVVWVWNELNSGGALASTHLHTGLDGWGCAGSWNHTLVAEI